MSESLSACAAQTLIAALVVLTAAVSEASAQAGGVSQSAETPVIAWPSGPLEVVAAFEKPIEPERARSLVGQTIRYFNVNADNKGTAQDDQPVGALRIVGVRIADSGRTLTLLTDPHPRVARYVLPVGALTTKPGSKPGPEAAISYDLSGVDWGWSPAADPGDEPQSKGWWPSVDLDTTKRSTRGSHPHELSMASLGQPGRMVFSGLLLLPSGTATVRLESTGAIEEATLGDVQGEPKAANGTELHRVELVVESKAEPLFLGLTVKTGAGRRPFELRAGYRMAGDKTDRILTRQQMIVSWAPLPAVQAANGPLVLPDLSGGDVARGKALFSSENARCSQCHSFRGQGGKIGPDLTEIGRKGAADIYRNIAAPSATIEPDYTSYTVASRDGRILVGVVRAASAELIRVTDTNAKSTEILRGQIQQIRPSGTSIMPVGLAAILGNSAIRDLIAFLTSSN